MNRVLPLCFVFILALGSCSEDCTCPGPTPTLPRHLLTLEDGYRYAYDVGFTTTTETFRLTDTVRVATAPSGEYFRMRYEHYDITGEGPERIILLMPMLRNMDDGLEYYMTTPPYAIDALQQDHDPILFWKFPYPAEVGTRWDNPDRPWQVQLTNKDTLVYARDGIQGYTCWMYEVFYTADAEPLLFYRVFFVPGEVVFKIEHVVEKIVAITYFWSWDS